jgi:nitrite reductase/ring-hydroxylating ferredoxin subunit
VRWTDWTGLKLALTKIAKSPRPLRTYEVRVEGGKVLVAYKGASSVGAA